jgi:hypothetical protein
MKERQKLHRRDTYTSGKSIIIKGGEMKMNISIKKVKLVKYGKGLWFTTQFLTHLKKMGIPGGVK